MTAAMKRSGIFVVALLALTACSTQPGTPAEVSVLLNLGTKTIQPPPPPPDACPDIPGVQTDTTLCPTIPPPPPNQTLVGDCRVDVGRTAATAHQVEGLQKFVMALNDRVRALTGLPYDLFVGGDGGGYSVECNIPGAKAAVPLDDVTTAISPAAVPFYQMQGMPPRNFFLKQHRPGVNEAASKPLQLLPFDTKLASKSIDAAFAKLPPPDFDFVPLAAVVPETSVSSVPGVYQINNVLRMEVHLAKAPTKDDGSTTADRVLNLKVSGVAGPDACAWAGDSCTSEQIVPNIQDRHIDPEANVMKPLAALVDDYKSKNKVITPAIFDELLAKNTYDTSHWLHMHFKALTGAGVAKLAATKSLGGKAIDTPAAIGFVVDPSTSPFGAPETLASYHLLVTEGYYSAEGGCGCRIGAPRPPLRQMILPSVMALLTLAGMCVARRRCAINR